MSEVKSDFDKKLAREVELEKIKAETAAKKVVLDSKRTSVQMNELIQNEKELAIIKKTSYGAMSPEAIDAIRKENLDYVAAARNTMTFINEEFVGVVPFYRKNLILIGGQSGEGKSTTVANIAYSVMQQKDPITGKRRRVLVITNEEKAEDVLNRITCLALGWHYVNHENFTDEQINKLDQGIAALTQNGKITVIDNQYNGAHGVTTSLEGIKGIFEGLLRDKEYYDAVIIDYYQNVESSKDNPSMNQYQVQARLAKLLDQYKNSYPAPIILMAQVKPPDEAETPFKFRIEGTKIITNSCTMTMEMVADRPNLRTEWIVWKSRFSAIGEGFHTGYENGKFVPYNDEFKQKAQRIIEKRQSNSLDRQMGIQLENKENKK